MGERRNVVVCKGLDQLSRRGAELFAKASAEAIEKSGRFSVALSGGSTPRHLYGLLAANPFRARVRWDRVHIFFGDERCVPPDDDESNYRMAREALLDKVPVPLQNVLRMEGEIEPPTAAARYEDGLRRAFELGPGQTPRFDLVFLGLGPDGHTASLFPGTPALGETERLAVANPVEKMGSTRLTLTLPVLNAARRVVFLVAGKDKAQVLRQVLKGEPGQFPAQLVRPTDGELVFLVDRAAANG
jgi:6-phosphogluconolactonase